MSAAFTPGPWKASIHQTLEDAREDSSFDWLHGHGDEAKFLPLGCVWKDTGTGLTGLPGRVETTAANARLIAAAPELYEALESIIAFKSDPYCKDSNPLQCCRHARKVAAAALAKARGEAA